VVENAVWKDAFPVMWSCP